MLEIGSVYPCTMKYHKIKAARTNMTLFTNSIDRFYAALVTFKKRYKHETLPARTSLRHPQLPQDKRRFLGIFAQPVKPA